MKRVVVTGTGALSALGSDWSRIEAGLRDRTNAVRRMDEWERYTEMSTRLGAPIDFAPPAHWSRKQLRGMGRVSQLAVRAAELALEDAGLLGDPLLGSGQVGVACGSSIGSTADISDFAQMLLAGS